MRPTATTTELFYTVTFY